MSKLFTIVAKDKKSLANDFVKIGELCKKGFKQFGICWSNGKTLFKMVCNSINESTLEKLADAKSLLVYCNEDKLSVQHSPPHVVCQATAFASCGNMIELKNVNAPNAFIFAHDYIKESADSGVGLLKSDGFRTLVKMVARPFVAAAFLYPNGEISEVDASLFISETPTLRYADFAENKSKYFKKTRRSWQGTGFELALL